MNKLSKLTKKSYMYAKLEAEEIVLKLKIIFQWLILKTKSLTLITLFNKLYKNL